jgi:hypothetical protein
MICNSFLEAEKAYIEGDPRKLAYYVEHHDLDTYESQFVARALLGEIKIQDGRKEMPWTKKLFYEYWEICRGGDLTKELFADKKKVTKADIYRALAMRHGNLDPATVKKSIERITARKSGKITPSEYLEAYINCKESGRKWPINSEKDAVELFHALLDEPFSAIRDTIKK